MLLECAVGDAYGAGFEFAGKNLTSNNLLSYAQHPRRPKNHIGRYTDDTQMSIGIAEHMLEEDRWTTGYLAKRFLDTYWRDKRSGYSPGFRAIMDKVTNVTDFLTTIKPTSTKSGSAMRVAPIGLYKNISSVIFNAAQQAKVTHNTVEGIDSAIAVAVATHYMYYGLGPKKNFYNFVITIHDSPINPYFKGMIDISGYDCVSAAFTAIENNNNLADVLKTVVDFSGDVDTAGAIAMSIASCSQEIEQNLPENLITTLENGPYGRDYIIELDKKLMAKFPRT